MSKGSGVTRGDRRRNAKKARLRALVPHENAVAGLDLGEKKQALAVTGADGLVLARRSLRVGVHDLGPYLDWALQQGRAAGFAGLSVACEPTGSGWTVQDLCAVRGLPFVCVQPLVSHVAREQEDLTGDKTRATARWSPGWRGSCIVMSRSIWRGRGRSCGRRGGGGRS
jgi:transposase